MKEGKRYGVGVRVLYQMNIGVFCVLILNCTMIGLVQCTASQHFIPTRHEINITSLTLDDTIFTSAPAPNKLSTTP